MVCAFDTID